MAEYSDNDAGRAGVIIDGLLSGETSRFDLQPGLAISDIEDDTIEFLDDLKFLSWIDANVPALPVGGKGLVPVSLSSLGLKPFPFGDPSRRYRDPFYQEFLYRYFRDLEFRKSSFEKTETISHEQAQSSFSARATEFLATRIAALGRFLGGSAGGEVPRKRTLNLRQRSGGSRTMVAGCSFSVSTNSPGLRVFWSGAYYISGNYFGHPTTPAVGVLQSGIYVFGVDGGAYGNTAHWDTSAICTLPGAPSVHLNF